MAKLMSATETPVYQFGEFELDPEERRLLARGEAITLTPKVFDTLVLLVTRAGHVVGKDELMQAVWPRGFVDDSNLTKHIWLIRKALGEHGREARFIETVAKRGYRFVARVDRVTRAGPDDSGVVRSADVPVHEDSAPDTRIDQPLSASILSANPLPASDGKRKPGKVVAVGVSLVAAMLLVWHFSVREKPSILVRNPPGTAVAIVAFNNLSQNTKDAWLGPALGEMLATEITSDGRLHALPDELVRPARADLPAPMAGGYAPDSLATLRKRLGMDYVLSGGYLVSGASDNPVLRIDLALQDARSGSTIATLARSGPATDLSSIVLETGSALREKLGMPTSDTADLQKIASAQPPSIDVARHMGFALDALHRNDAARARDELLDAIAQAPGYAPLYSYLAQAWSAMGYQAKALAAAQQAAAQAQGLPWRQQMEIETQVYEARFNWRQAIETLRKLIVRQPEDPEYRLRLIKALLAAGEVQHAHAEVDLLRRLKGWAPSDPRVELMAARVAAALDDSAERARHAQLALTQATRREDSGLAADAKMQLALAEQALGKLDESATLFRDAIATYQRVDNPRGEAYARQNLANSLMDKGKQPDAREEYEHAMRIYQQIGDQSGIAAIYSNVARLLWDAGDRDGAETAAEHSLRIRRDTGDIQGQAWNLTALAIMHSDEAASDAAVEEFKQAIELDERSGMRSHQVFLMTSYSDLLRERGQLDEATKFCRQASTDASALKDVSATMSAVFQCALIALDRNDIEAATSGFERTQKIATEIKDPVQRWNPDLSLAQIAMGRGEWSAARDRLQKTIAGFSDADLVAGEANAQALIALCYQQLGMAAARDVAAARARLLRSRITERGEVFLVDIALAELGGEIGGDQERASAVSALDALATDAEKRRWLALSFEARIGAVRLLGNEVDAMRRRRDLRNDAREHGFEWIVSRLGKPLQARHVLNAASTAPRS